MIFDQKNPVNSNTIKLAKRVSTVLFYVILAMCLGDLYSAIFSNTQNSAFFDLFNSTLLNNIIDICFWIFMLYHFYTGMANTHQITDRQLKEILGLAKINDHISKYCEEVKLQKRPLYRMEYKELKKIHHV